MDTYSKRLIQKGSPFELQKAIIEGIPYKIFPHGPKTLQDVFLKAASFRQSEFIVSDDKRLSFGEALEQAKYLAVILRRQYGTEKGKRVAIIMNNRPEWIIAFMAIYLCGAVAVTIHADTEKQAVLKALEITDCSLVISDEYNINKLNNNEIDYTVVIFSNNNSDELMNDLREKNSSLILSLINLSEVPDNKTVPIHDILIQSPDDDALISFTSGTTGTPKGVLLSHRNITTGLMNMMLGGFLMNYRASKPKTDKKMTGQNIQPCTLLLSPLSHIGGYSQIMLMCYLGGKIVMMDGWDASGAVNYIKQEKIRSLSGASTDMIRELLHSNLYRENLETLTNLNINGVALKKGFIQYVTEKLPDVTIATGYGMTETCGSISNVTGTELINNPNWIGTVLPSVDVKIVDESGNEQSSGDTGEVCVRGSMVMKEYFSNPVKTNAVLENGWLKTGDLGYLDTNENLYITVRIEDVIICNNHYVSAGELESLISDHSMVDEVVALGIPSSERSEKIVLAILAKDRLQNEEQNLEREFSSIIKKYPVDIKIVCVDSLPRTASGKVNRNELRKQILRRL